MAAAARRAWCVATPPNLIGETTPSPAAHVRSQPATRPSSPAWMKPSSSLGTPSSAGPTIRGTAKRRWTSRRSPLGSSTTPDSSRRATAPVRSVYARPLELLGHRRARLLAEQRQRRALRGHDGHADVVLAHRPGLAGRHERQLVGRQRPHGAGGTAIAIRFA